MQGNLHDIYYDLNEFQKAFIKRMVNAYGKQEVEVHKGNLVFFKREVVIQCLQACVKEGLLVGGSPDQRQAVKLLDMLKANVQSDSFDMYLDDTRVRKFSTGSNPNERVIRLRIKTKVESGIRFNHFKRRYEKVEDLVSSFASCKRLKPGFWRVTVKRTILDQTKVQMYEFYGK